MAVKADRAARRQAKPARRPAPEARSGRRPVGARRPLRVVYDIDGPRIRLGILWFACGIAAVVVGVGALALVYGTTAAVAALQTARAWRNDRGARPHRLVAGVGALVLVAAAAIDTALVGLALLGLAAAAVVVAHRGRRRSHPIEDAGFTLQASMFVGLAAASVVLSYRFELGAAVSLIVLVAAYETGDYLIGSGSRNPYEGPLGGLAAVLVVTFTIALLRVPPFEAGEAWVFGGLTAVLAPLGQLAGSLVLPSNRADAPALRRLDSLLLLAPLWAWATGILAAGSG